MVNGQTHQLAQVGICTVLLASSGGAVCLPKQSKDFTFFTSTSFVYPSFVPTVAPMHGTLICLMLLKYWQSFQHLEEAGPKMCCSIMLHMIQAVPQSHSVERQCKGSSVLFKPVRLSLNGRSRRGEKQLFFPRAPPEPVQIPAETCIKTM